MEILFEKLVCKQGKKQWEKVKKAIGEGWKEVRTQGG